jgi:molecular chaperone DnaK
VTPLSLGVEVRGGLFERVIHRNTTIPTRASKDFTTATDGQTEVAIRVFQGERERAEENALLDEFTLRDIPAAEAGVPRIEVTFAIDTDGIVQVNAEEVNTGQSETVTIEGGVGLPEEDIEAMRAEARRHETADRERRRQVEARNRVQDSIARARRTLAAREDPDPAVVEGLEAVIEDAERLLEDDVPTDDLNRAHDRFEEILSELGVSGHPGSDRLPE